MRIRYLLGAMLGKNTILRFGKNLYIKNLELGLSFELLTQWTYISARYGNNISIH